MPKKCTMRGKGYDELKTIRIVAGNAGTKNNKMRDTIMAQHYLPIFMQMDALPPNNNDFLGRMFQAKIIQITYLIAQAELLDGKITQLQANDIKPLFGVPSAAEVSAFIDIWKQVPRDAGITGGMKKIKRSDSASDDEVAKIMGDMKVEESMPKPIIPKPVRRKLWAITDLFGEPKPAMKQKLAGVKRSYARMLSGKARQSRDGDDNMDLGEEESPEVIRKRKETELLRKFFALLRDFNIDRRILPIINRVPIDEPEKYNIPNKQRIQIGDFVVRLEDKRWKIRLDEFVEILTEQRRRRPNALNPLNLREINWRDVVIEYVENDTSEGATRRGQGKRKTGKGYYTDKLKNAMGEMLREARLRGVEVPQEILVELMGIGKENLSVIPQTSVMGSSADKKDKERVIDDILNRLRIAIENAERPVHNRRLIARVERIDKRIRDAIKKERESRPRPPPSKPSTEPRPEAPELPICSVCLEPIKPSEKYTGVCGHSIHKKCYDGLVVRNGKKQCPMCRLNGYGKRKKRGGADEEPELPSITPVDESDDPKRPSWITQAKKQLKTMPATVMFTLFNQLLTSIGLPRMDGANVKQMILQEPDIDSVTNVPFQIGDYVVGYRRDGEAPIKLKFRTFFGLLLQEAERTRRIEFYPFSRIPFVPEQLLVHKIIAANPDIVPPVTRKRGAAKCVGGSFNSIIIKSFIPAVLYNAPLTKNPLETARNYYNNMLSQDLKIDLDEVLGEPFRFITTYDELASKLKKILTIRPGVKNRMLEKLRMESIAEEDGGETLIPGFINPMLEKLRKSRKV